MVSKAELKNFFRKLGALPVDKKLRAELGLTKGLDLDPEKGGKKNLKTMDEGLDSDRKGLVRHEEA